MSKANLEEPGVLLLKRFQEMIHYGLILQSIRFKLMRNGVEFTPYYLMQEGLKFVTIIPEINGIPKDYSFAFLGPDDIKTMGVAKVVGFFSEEKSLALLKAGGKCIALKHNEEIAAYMWIDLAEINFIKSKIIPLKSNEAYLWEIRTTESYKGKNLAPYLRYKSYEVLKEMGRDVLYSVSVCFNKPTIRFKKKLNAKKLKLLLFIQLFNKFRRHFTLKSYKINKPF